MITCTRKYLLYVYNVNLFGYTSSSNSQVQVYIHVFLRNVSFTIHDASILFELRCGSMRTFWKPNVIIFFSFFRLDMTIHSLQHISIRVKENNISKRYILRNKHCDWFAVFFFICHWWCRNNTKILKWPCAKGSYTQLIGTTLPDTTCI
jgi:hypothetical protein